MRRCRCILTTIGLVVLPLLPGQVWAQLPTTGSVAGRVTDGDGAVVPGARITLDSSQGERVLVTDDLGRFLAPYLTPGSYDLRLDMPGFQPVEQKNVMVQIGRRLELDFVLHPGTFVGELEVAGDAPIIDFSTTSNALVIDSSFLSRVAVGRGLADTLYLAPGVSSGGGAGRSNPSMSGGSGLENQYIVDGVNITDPRYGALGVYVSDYGSMGNGVTYDFIGEIQVRTAGAETSLDQSTGGVVNIVTKSGSNQHHGRVFGYLTPADLEGDRELLQLANGAVNITAEQRDELGFTAGGPIRRDRVFYFIAANRQQGRTTFLAPEGFPLRTLGEADRTRNVLAYAVKGTYLVGPAHRLDLSLFGDPADSPSGPQAASTMLSDDIGAFSSLEYGGHNQALAYQGAVTGNWLLEATVARAASYFREQPLVDEWLVDDETTTPPTTSGGRGRFEADNRGESRQARLTSTHLLGGHELSWGASLEDVWYDSFRDLTGPPITLSNGQRTTSGAQVTVLPDPDWGSIWRVTRANLRKTRESDGEYLGAFVQDRITVGDDLTLTLGLRWESEHLAGDTSGATFSGNWAPRAGIVYDLGGKGRVKLFASAGKFYAKIPINIALGLFGDEGRVLRADYFDASLTQPVPEGVRALDTTQHLLLGGADPVRVDPGAALTSIREGTVGAEVAAHSDLTLGIRFIYRDMPTVLEDVGTAAMVLYFSGEPGFESVDYFLTNPHAGYPATINAVGAFEDPVHRYQALELTADKRYADHWSLLASYRWSRLRGTYEGFYRNDTDRSAGGNSGLFDFPTADPSYTEIGGPVYGFGGDIRYLGQPGPLPNDRTHQVKVYGAYTFDSGLTLGGGAFLSSGRPLTPMAANPVYNRAGDIPEAPRGQGIPTEDGFRTRTQAEWSLDLHAEYRFRLAGGTLGLAIDVFNLLDNHAVTAYDQNVERRFRRPNADFGRIIAHQEPRQVRLGVGFEF